jgi:hypothetical protein
MGFDDSVPALLRIEFESGVRSLCMSGFELNPGLALDYAAAGRLIRF